MVCSFNIFWRFCYSTAMRLLAIASGCLDAGELPDDTETGLALMRPIFASAIRNALGGLAE